MHKLVFKKSRVKSKSEHVGTDQVRDTETTNSIRINSTLVDRHSEMDRPDRVRQLYSIGIPLFALEDILGREELAEILWGISKFEIFKDKKGEYRFRLKLGNGQIVLASEGYKQKPSAMNAIESIRKNSLQRVRFELKDTASGMSRFNLRARNGQVIGTSESFKTKEEREDIITAILYSAAGAANEDQAS